MILYTITHPRQPGCCHFLDKEDVRTLLERLPEKIWNRLRVVHFQDRGYGPRLLGYANRRGEISLRAALPREVCLTSYLPQGCAPALFGAPPDGAWPEEAVRRFLLYDVLLHELGRLQHGTHARRAEGLRYEREPRAQEFAEQWRARLWASRFDHPEPAHNPPPTFAANRTATTGSV